MKFTLDLPSPKIHILDALFKEWREKRYQPLTYCERLGQIEKAIALELSYILLQTNDWERLQEEITCAKEK